jgi:hypothetical protein
MDRKSRDQCRNGSSHAIFSHVNEIDRVRAIEGMKQAMILGELAIAAFGHLRRSLKAFRDTMARVVILR